ncbi:MAG: hypothetical protein SGI72_08510 [Planctomycetota bacterium]|nr:hypothetical protein [Planctomycetota bacterium]
MSVLTLLSALWIGVLAGGQHALTGPDHFAGVAPFAATSGKRAWRVGLVWGLGHASGALAAAAIALVLRAWIPGAEEHVSSVSDRIVGILMCVLGALGLRAAVRAHEHVHAPTTSPYFLGLFHGAGGLAHLFAVLPALGLPGLLLPTTYLTGYAVGSLACVTAFAAGFARLAPESSPIARRRLLVVASSASIAVGLFWIVRPA